MKKMTVFMLVLLIGVFIGGYITPIKYYYKKDYGYINTFLAKNKIQTVKDYAKWLKANIKYKSEIGTTDDWQLPRETVTKKTGDCEDFAFLTKDILEALGYEVKIYAVREIGYGHAVAIFKYGDTWCLFDNTEFFDSSFTSETLFFTLLNRVYKYSWMQEINYE